MSELPTTIHTAAQVRARDRHAIEQLGIAGYTLMTRAAQAALDCLQRSWPEAQRISVICGSGNNAGDGYALARLARAAGLQVTTIALFDATQLQGDALTAFHDFSAAGGIVEQWDDQKIQQADVIVDALFGTGLSRPLDARLVGCVATLNSVSKPVLALDVPTGLHADTGEVLGAAIHATRTITFVGLKIGLYVGNGPDYSGVIECDALGIPRNEADDEHHCVAQRLSIDWLQRVLPRRPRLAHKGSNGRVLLVGGGRGMAGAARLAGEAALRVGAGLVTVVTRPENVSPIVASCPELIVRTAENAADLQPLIAQADVIAIGPGLGKEEWSRVMYAMVLSSDKPLIVDADALNLLGMEPHARGNWVLTPHPGEASRLLKSSIADVQADRLNVAQRIADRYNAIAVLKGAGSLIARNESLPHLCDRGNPGMATAGTGDVLTGTILGLAAQMKDLWSATCAGVLIHAMAGDAAAEEGGERGMIASDLLPYLRASVN